MSLRTRFILYFGLGGAFFLVALSVLVFNRMEAVMTEELKQRFQENFHNRVTGLSQLLNARSKEFQSSAKLPMFRSMRFHQLTLNTAAEKNDIRHLELSFMEMIEQRPEIQKVRFINQKGFEALRVESSGIKRALSDYSVDPEIQHILNLKQGEFSVKKTGHDNKVKSISWAFPVHVSGNRAFGAIVFDVDFNYIAQQVYSLLSSDEESVCVLDETQKLIIAKTRTDACTAEHREHEDVGNDWHLDKKLGAQGFDWEIHFSVNPQPFLTGVAELKDIVFGVILPLMCIILILSASIVSNRISKAIFTLLRSAQAMGKGEIFAPLNFHRQDELGQLAQEINRSAAMIAASKGKLENDLQRLSETTHAAIISIDLNGYINDWNRGAEETTLYLKSEVTGQKLATLFENLTDQQLSNVINAMHTNRVIENAEMIIHAKSGEQLVLLFNWSSSLDENGEIIGLTGVGQDVTALKNAEKNALQASKVKSEFLAAMSHEIRTPMTGIIGFADMLIEEEDNPDHRNKVLRIKKSTEGLLRIVNDILDISKLEAGKLEIEHLDFQLKELVRETLDMFHKNRATDKGVEIKLDFTPDFPNMVQSDPTRIRQVLVNIIGNAFKFTHEGSVHISCSKEAGLIKIAVQDSGIGMSEEVQATLFSDFTQADASISRKYEGTGLGLAISKRLIELLDGQIGVDSEEGIGSTFWFTFPYIQATTTSQPDKKDKGLSANQYKATASLNILVAEDNRVNQTIIDRFLSAYGHKMTIVENGEEAVDSLRDHDYDLILMDIRMPGMDGMEATRIIRKMTGPKSNIPIIAITADAVKENVNSYLECGMNSYASKPFNWGKLVLCINDVLEQDIHIPKDEV
ncbi:ATP-binding protein [Terasakiella sp. SH-1]|uniref:ATP-binding protein n=1 Tax=Terasakiella sp. SH-1 TaxID=2560057 RepID=UPI00107391B4|nr:ATP-binding protein [Terasakiella sp. SH-1]